MSQSTKPDWVERGHLLKALAVHRDGCCDTKELDSVQRAIAFLQANPVNWFSRENLTGHVTASAWVLNETKTHVLLTHHKKLSRWLQLGGHCDDSDVFMNALREVQEESGLNPAMSSRIFDVDVHSIPEHKGIPEHLHIDIRYQAIAGGQPQTSDESHDVQWVPLAELERYTTAHSLLRMRDKSAF